MKQKIKFRDYSFWGKLTLILEYGIPIAVVCWAIWWRFLR